jgi:signal transduction histidine kinase
MGGPIYLSYLLPSLLSKEHPIDNVALFIAHNVFILVTVIFIAIIQHFNLLRQREIFFANLELSKAKNSLEDINQKLENTNQKLEDTNQELHKLDRIKNEFFANITHELRTPLTMILTPVDAIIQKDIGDFQPEQMTYFHSIRENGLRLLKLINDLLDLTRLQDSQIKLRIEQVQIMDFLNNIIEIVQGMADRKRIKLSMNCHEDSLWFDQVHLERVMLNIIANSLKFTPPGGEIQIETLHTNGDVTISVRDTGIGIPQHHIPHIFDRFFQSDSSSTRQYGGSGIGLSLVKELIELHEGQIRVESEEGQGTTVYIKLHKGHSHFRKELLDRRQKTRAEEHKRRSDDLGVSEWTSQIVDQESFRYLDIDLATERRAVPRIEHGLKHARILIIEDSPELLRLLHSLLSEQYEIFTATDGNIGLDLARSTCPDLILSDLMLPGIDGLSLCKELKADANTNHIPIVMLTARTRLEDRIEGLERGADAYLTKPFSPKELLTVIKELLKKRSNTAKMLLHKRLNSLQILSARLAHEIFNPLNMLKNSIEVVEMQIKQHPDQAIQISSKPFLDIAHRAIPRIHQTVELMKKYSQEGYTQQRRTYSPAESIPQLLQLISVPPNKTCDIQLLCSSESQFYCSPAEFNQVFTNIIENAIDAIATEGKIEIRIFDTYGFVNIEIEDNGCGISKEDMDRVFSPFFTTKGPGKGMGLGMTICLQTIEDWGGTIDLRSQLNIGTMVSIKMPQASAH